MRLAKLLFVFLYLYISARLFKIIVLPNLTKSFSLRPHSSFSSATYSCFCSSEASFFIYCPKLSFALFFAESSFTAFNSYSGLFVSWMPFCSSLVTKLAFCCLISCISLLLRLLSLRRRSYWFSVDLTLSICRSGVPFKEFWETFDA